MWSGPGLASGRGAAPSELLFKGSRDGGGGGQYLQSYIFFRMSLYFSILFTAGMVFLFPVLYICCLFTVWQGLVVPRVLTFNASGIPPKRYIKDGDAECLINFNTITLLGDRYFTVLLDLSTLMWQQSQDVEDIRFLVFNFLHLCRRFIIGR